MRRDVQYLVILLCSIFFTLPCLADKQISLRSLDLNKMTSGWGTPQIDQSVEKKPLTIAGKVYKHGIGTHAPSLMHIALDGKARQFSTWIGVDDETNGRGSIALKLYGDKKTIFESDSIRGGDKPQKVEVDLSGIHLLTLMITTAGDDRDFDHADLIEPTFVSHGKKPKAIERPVVKEEKVILTPKPGPEPHINGPKVHGCRPGHPFLYRIPCTGVRPMRFSADNLPDSLELDAKTGIITGIAPRQRGEYMLLLKAKNHAGMDERECKIVVGDTIALTPPMGWNHWYTFYNQVSDRLFREAADAMVESGMADYGYQYVNIDDCWMVKPGADDPTIGGEPRDANGAMRPNKHFPDMKALTDYIHKKGLKAGLYTSPGPLTCQRYAGSYEHERIDAETYAQWGFDFLKYDWCSYGRVAGGDTLEHKQKPYIKMGEILKSLDRDIVYNLCQYGMGDVWTWGGKVGGHCWRTTGDLGLRAGDRLPGFYHIGFSNAQHADYAQPGEWNDPDYILIGYVGNARKHDAPPKQTDLTPNEQYSYMSMWCLMAAPLVYSGDIRRLDAFTLNILCNAEMIAIDQDPLGVQGKMIRKTDEEFILAKPMQDGSLAVGLFNLAEWEKPVKVSWEELNLEGKQTVRDVWRQKNIGKAVKEFEVSIPRHGVKVIRLFSQQ